MNEVRLVWFLIGLVLGVLSISAAGWRAWKRIVSENMTLKHNLEVMEKHADFWKNYYYQERDKWDNY